MIDRPLVPKEKIIRFFDTLDDWALLRNSDVFASFERGGDCDLVVGSIRKSEERMRVALGHPIRIARRSYVISYYYPWGHIDLTKHYYWRGIKLYDGKYLLRDRQGNKWPRISDVDESVTLLMTSLLWGGFVKKRYITRVLEVYQQDPLIVKKRLAIMLGDTAGAEVEMAINNDNWLGLERDVDYLRRQVKRHYFLKNPFTYWMGKTRFLIHELVLRVTSRAPAIVFRIGEDMEVGKIRNLIDEVALLRGYQPRVFDYSKGCSGYCIDFDLLKGVTFRSRNGLMVFLIKNNTSAYIWNKVHQFELTSHNASVINSAISKIQNCNLEEDENERGDRILNN